ncbi:MAG: hypothetical protein M1830_007255 [Pleopsidium flavum]|nr:MAG: hypothetical protein M1830_007255 [Pleopsidium flavum]
MSSPNPIHRMTLFKVPSPSDQEAILHQYMTFKNTATKDGKPYILTCDAGKAIDDPRSQGWDIAVKTTFGSEEDMAYYDHECEAHKELKAVAGPRKTDVMTVYFESVFDGVGEKL